MIDDSEDSELCKCSHTESTHYGYQPKECALCNCEEYRPSGTTLKEYINQIRK